jgi:hypothetical protein
MAEEDFKRWVETRRRRTGQTLTAFGTDFTQRVVLHGAPAVLVRTPALVREIMGSAAESVPGGVTDGIVAKIALHQVFMVYNAAIRMLMFEYDAAIGPCFMEAKLAVEVTEYFDPESGKQVRRASLPRSSLPHSHLPLR